MSGGSYDYAYGRIEDLADDILLEGRCSAASPSLREAFKVHLRDVAAACRAIEWNDSNDGADDETELIRKCLTADAELDQAVTRAKSMTKELREAIKQAERI